MNRFNISNNQITGLIIGILLLLAGICGAFSPLIFSMDMMNAGYAIQCFSLFVIIMGLVTFLIYVQRYFRLRSILNGKDILLHWQYPQEEYEREVLKDKQERAHQNLITLGIVWFFFIVISLIFVFIAFSEGEEDSLPMFLGIMGGVLLLVNLAAFIMPGVIYRFSLAASPQVIVARKGMYFMGQLHLWGSALSFIENVSISGDRKYLDFDLRYFTKLGWYKYESYTISVPIPKGKIKEAQRVVESLALQ